MPGVLGELDQSSMWLIVALAVLTMGYTIMRGMKRPKKDPLGDVPSFAAAAQQRATEREMQNLLVELAEMSRQVSAQLDTRAKKLELLIDQADEKLRQLQQMVTSQPAIVGVVGAIPASEAADPMTERIYTLADQGKTPRQISEALACPPGEVELILALRGKPAA
jgi:hypothetical protein